MVLKIICISGSTGSGKTTLWNSFFHHKDILRLQSGMDICDLYENQSVLVIDDVRDGVITVKELIHVLNGTSRKARFGTIVLVSYGKLFENPKLTVSNEQRLILENLLKDATCVNCGDEFEFYSCYNSNIFIRYGFN